ncbi:hypothetical protein N2152v2_003065 [Parachlorella kessleri]
MASQSIKVVPTAPSKATGYPYKFNFYLAWCTFWGGFVHFTIGYDSGVAGGLFTKKSFLQRFYPNFHGRKDTPYCQVTADTSNILLLGRAFCGFGEGFGMFVYNIYLAEIAPAQLRGKIVGTSVTWSASGVLFGQLVNYLVFQRSNGWQIAVSMVSIPAGLLALNSLFMHDTPISLLMRNKREAALVSLRKYRGVEDVEDELQDMELFVKNRISTVEALKLVARKRQYWPGLIINLGPQVFALLGFGAQTALWNSIVVGGAKIFGVFIGVFVLDTRLVRRKLLVTGGILQTIFLAATAIVFAIKVEDVKGAQVTKGVAAVILVLIIIYEIAFMGGQHVPTLGMAAEVVPIEVRQVVFPINMIAYASQSMAISYSFTFMLCAMVWGTFLFFAGLTALLAVWAYFFMPETHHVPLERVHSVVAEHKVWRRFFPATDTEAATRAGGLELADAVKSEDSLKRKESSSGSVSE